MAWETSKDVADFLDNARDLLAADPVRNTVLLTEAYFWRWLPDPPPGARFGWWVEDGDTRAAFVEVPDHDPVCSPLTRAAAAALPGALPDAIRVGVDEQDASTVAGAFGSGGRPLQPITRIRVLRLEELPPPAPPPGQPRAATPDDLPVLHEWFGLFQQRYPTDPSQVEFIVDHPLSAGAIVVWELDGRPVAMSSRSPEVAGMTRMGLAFQPSEGSMYADAAFAAGCAEAARTTEHVLVLSGDPDATELESLGFVGVLDRVKLGP